MEAAPKAKSAEEKEALLVVYPRHSPFLKIKTNRWVVDYYISIRLQIDYRGAPAAAGTALMPELQNRRMFFQDALNRSP